ncbi:uncharacterized protein PHACADRAFT_26327 [Phanerochaete carnosa HHB-10118-sp]|uniref:Uncharacterized protein n=1 Tax=Phanerochaete carnosa (strain HHB-10118-sp) TaxID=650164 RepID=K5WF73_PHACS|nr:uncharacterized protein PHACADRAFT_26327 [Phanerochaete carnosa HHB-10118-sp]EKM57734.1 hypothetical protein PHACADRAFT_26327 [Phanerochaete carnosa HHB-10118-sp]
MPHILPTCIAELVSDAESDGVSFCTPASGDSTCAGRRMVEGFIVAAAVKHADDGSWIQVTGCIDPTKSSLDPSDTGGQMDVRFPNGAQCTFGGYGASFIELFVLCILLVYVALMRPLSFHVASESSPRQTGSVYVAAPPQMIRSIAIRTETERGVRMLSLEHTISPSSVPVARNAPLGGLPRALR